MKNLIKKIEELYETKARHRRGFRLGDLTIEMIANNIIDESHELKEAVLDATYIIDREDAPMKEELADIIAACVHLMMRLGMNTDELEQLAIEKIKRRFVVEQ